MKIQKAPAIHPLLQSSPRIPSPYPERRVWRDICWVELGEGGDRCVCNFVSICVCVRKKIAFLTFPPSVELFSPPTSDKSSSGLEDECMFESCQVLRLLVCLRISCRRKFKYLVSFGVLFEIPIFVLLESFTLCMYFEDCGSHSSKIQTDPRSEIVEVGELERLIPSSCGGWMIYFAGRAGVPGTIHPSFLIQIAPTIPCFLLY